MRKVLLIDTSLLCVWLKVPGRETAGNNEWNFERVEQKIFLTDDDKLKSQEPPSPLPPIRRSSRKKG
jgi:hypothetical protein